MIFSEKISYCRVLRAIGKEIDFELLLPGDWNQYRTYKGHGLKADWALDNMERQFNFGHLAILQTAILDQCYELDGVEERLGRKWQSS